MSNVSLHYRMDRQQRNDLINNVIGIGEIVDTFQVDKGHPNGPELHSITTTGLIIIHNAITKKFVTTLIARPQQIKRYYQNEGIQAPQEIVDMAFEHQLSGYNEM